MGDCTPFNINRVRQLLDCATDEEQNCLTKLISYSIVLRAIDNINAQKKKHDDKRDEKIVAEILRIVCVLADEASLEITGNPLFTDDLDKSGEVHGKK